MKLAYLNIGIGVPEVILIVLAIFFIIVIGRYGKNTALGYWGSILLAIFTTPVVAFIVITILKAMKRN
jgi:hypothetical protein